MSIALLALGSYLIHEHSETRYLFLTFAVCAFFGYAAELQQGMRRERIATEETSTSALRDSPPPSLGSLIVLRWGYPSKLLGMNISLNGRSLVQLKSPRFTRIDLPAGDYELSAEFCSYLANKRSPKSIGFRVSEGQLAIIGIAVGLPERWRWWRLGSRENWRDQIYMTIAPEEVREQTLSYLAKIKMIMPDQVVIER